MLVAAMSPYQLRKFCALDEPGRQSMEMVNDRLGFSARIYTCVFKVASTIADLAGEAHILQEHLAEATLYRRLGRKTV